MERRVKLEKNIQREVILKASKKMGSLKKLSEKLKIPYSTLKKYGQEIFLLPETPFKKIIKISEIEKESLKIKYLKGTWGRAIGGKKGMETLEKKYPEKINQWRRKGLKKSSARMPRKIKNPLLDEKLAEFIGIYLGDGTITKYFIRISGDFRYDQPYFKYIKKIVEELFGIKATITKEKKHNTMYITIFSKEMCSFLKQNYKINFGHKIKNKTSIPHKILKDNKLAFACIRGLIDTDGTISRRGKNGKQFCIEFTAHNKKLLEQVTNIMNKKGLFTFGDKTNTGTNSKEKILRYFEEIGSSNLRHIVRFHERFYNKNTIYRKDVTKYYQKDFYNKLDLPFKVKQAL
jgi:hypothetical protein